MVRFGRLALFAEYPHFALVLDNLAFVFDQPNSQFTIAGDSSFTVGGVTIGASFGSPLGTQGLVIQSGELTSVNLAITTSFSCGSVPFNTQDLRLKLDTGTPASTATP